MANEESEEDIRRQKSGRGKRERDRAGLERESRDGLGANGDEGEEKRALR